MQSAKSLGKVVLVTNSVRPWVATSIRNFMPSLLDSMKGIPIIYAQEKVEKLRNEGFDEDTKCILTAIKMTAMKEAVNEFYSQYQNQSWKNMLSIGDGLFEHKAIREVKEFRPHQDDTTKSTCRVKTIKMMDNPTVAGLTVQVSLLRCWMDGIVLADSDIDIDLNSSEETIERWHKKFATKS